MTSGFHGPLRQGFIRAVGLCLRVVEDGLYVGGPPCGPWIFINAGTHKRRISNIWGDLTSKYVLNSNALLGMALMFLFALYSSGWFLAALLVHKNKGWLLDGLWSYFWEWFDVWLHSLNNRVEASWDTTHTSNMFSEWFVPSKVLGKKPICPWLSFHFSPRPHSIHLIQISDRWYS